MILLKNHDSVSPLNIVFEDTSVKRLFSWAKYEGIRVVLTADSALSGPVDTGLSSKLFLLIHIASHRLMIAAFLHHLFLSQSRMHAVPCMAFHFRFRGSTKILVLLINLLVLGLNAVHGSTVNHYFDNLS